MNDNAYLRLNSDNVDLFEWTRTADGQIIVRDPEIGEILISLERPLNQKHLIAEAYHEGLKTGISLSQRYTQFLERLTAPLLADYQPPETEYLEPSLEHIAAHKHIVDGEGVEAGDHYSYEFPIPKALLDKIDIIMKTAGVRFTEKFASMAVEDNLQSCTSLEPGAVLAIPNNGPMIRAFLADDLNASYLSIARRLNFPVQNLIYTAIHNCAGDICLALEHSLGGLFNDLGEVISKAPVTLIQPQRPLHKVRALA